MEGMCWVEEVLTGRGWARRERVPSLRCLILTRLLICLALIIEERNRKCQDDALGSSWHASVL